MKTYRSRRRSGCTAAGYPTGRRSSGMPGFRLAPFWRDDHGGTAVLMAIGLIFTAGIASLGVDYARITTMEQALSSAADVAALAAATRLPDGDAARTAALEYVEKNLPRARYGETLLPADVEIGSWDANTRTFIPAAGRNDSGNNGGQGGQGSSGGTGGIGMANAVRVTTRLAGANGNALDLLFAPIFGRDGIDVAASAVAGRDGTPCVVALHPTAPSSMSLNGLAKVETLGCGVQVNSTADSALTIRGVASLEATDICVGGAAQVRIGGASPGPREYCPGLSDPMADLEKPDFGGCDYVDRLVRGSRETLLPGVYCGGLDIGGLSNVDLAPGLYVIEDGPFALGPVSSIEGDDVTIFLTGPGAVVSFESGSIVNLRAPTGGDLAGILFFQDPDFGGIHEWKALTSTELRGVIYLPAGTLAANNDNAMTPEGSCVVLIANTLVFDLLSGASIDVSGVDCRGALAGPYRRGIALLQ